MRATSGSSIYRPDLGLAIMEYVEGETMGFIGTELMPIFPVPEQASTIPVIPKEAMLKIPSTARAPRGGYQRGDWEYERGKYSTSENGWEEPLDDTERKLFEQEVPGAGDFIATKRAWNHIMRSQEKRIADMLFNATNFTAHAVSDEWDDGVNATPIDDVNDGIISFRSACGMLPDVLVIAYSTFLDLKNCTQIVDRLKYTYPGIDINRMNSQQLAAVFNVPRCLVAGSIYDSAKKGAAASISDLWSNEYALLAKIASTGDIAQPGLGFTFLWTEDSAENPIVEQYREDQIRSDIFRCRHNTDEWLMHSENTSGTTVSSIYAACGYLFSNITT